MPDEEDAMLEIRPLYDDVFAHAKQEYPREACGLLVRLATTGALVYRRCRNIAPLNGGRDSFVMAPRDLARAELDGDVLAVVHSHPDDSAEPSSSDRHQCHRSGVAWYVLAVPDGAMRRIDPEPLPLLGRQFHHGVVDCYTLVQDAFAQRLGITLPDFDRADGWWERGENLYLEHFEEAGFVHVGHPHQMQPREHDAVLMQVASRVPNHAAVVEADGTIVHHLYGRLSGRDVWGGYWQRHGTHVLRHRSLL